MLGLRTMRVSVKSSSQSGREGNALSSHLIDLKIDRVKIDKSFAVAP
jgi:hypothetical protein